MPHPDWGLRTERQTRCRILYFTGKAEKRFSFSGDLRRLRDLGAFGKKNKQNRSKQNKSPEAAFTKSMYTAVSWSR